MRVRRRSSEMTKYITAIVLLILALMPAPGPAQNLSLSYDSPLEDAILTKWVISHKLTADTLSALLIAEGTDDQRTISAFKSQYHLLINRIKEEIDRENDVYDLAEEIFNYFHEHLLKRYLAQTRFIDIVNTGSYNAITGCLMYFLVCREFKIPVYIVQSGNYLYTQIKSGNQKVNVNVIDREGGFNQRSNRKDMLELLVRLGYVTRTEIQLYGEDESYKKYIGNPAELEIYEVMALFYNNRGYTFLELGNVEKALLQFEKSMALYPENDMLRANYKSALYHLSDITVQYSDFITFYKNALILLNDDETFSDAAINMARRALFYYADEQRQFKKAVDLSTDFKLNFAYDKYLVALNEIERDIEIMWAQTLNNRGFYDLAYEKFRDIYYFNKTTPKNKDMYVDATISYVRYLMTHQGNDERILMVLDTLIAEAPEYNRVKEIYMLKFVDAFSRCVGTDLKKAQNIAHQAYKFDPQHQFSHMAIIQVYTQMSMTELRKQNIKKAYNLILEGLKYYPNETSLIQILDEIEKEMGYN
jgi:tetratricopeptide (TPR) repeat protein